MARYLGPQQFGQISFAIAFVALFSGFSNLGLDTVIIRNLVRTPDSTEEILGSAWVLKFVGSCSALLLATVAIVLVRPGDTLSIWLVCLSAGAFLFQSVDIIEMWLRSSLRSRFSVISKTISVTVAAMGKSGLILAGAPLIAFAWMGLAEAMLGSFALLAMYIRLGGNLRTWRVHAVRVKAMATEGLPLTLSAMVVILYMRIDQVMISEMMNDAAVGTYAAATKISEAFYFIPQSLVMSLAPVLVQAKESGEAVYLAKVEQMFSIVAVTAVLIAVPMSILARPLITLILGHDFESAAPVLQVHIWALIFVALSIASGHYLAIEGQNSISLQRTAAGAAVNIGLNLLWIPRYGIMGAAWASLIAYAVATCFLFQSMASRKCLNMMVKSLRPRSVGVLWQSRG
jgi:polysaccharide transporter, PST family